MCSGKPEHRPKAPGYRRRMSHRIVAGDSSRKPAPASARAEAKRLVRDKALALGFDAVGFCRAELGAEARERLASFLAAGQHGDMGWLAQRAEQRSHPRSLWPEARS